MGKIKGLLIAIFFVVISVASVYTGLIWGLAGGLNLIIHGAQANPMVAHDIALGLVRVLLFVLILWVVYVAGLFLSMRAFMSRMKVKRE